MLIRMDEPFATYEVPPKAYGVMVSDFANWLGDSAAFTSVQLDPAIMLLQ